MRLAKVLDMISEEERIVVKELYREPIYRGLYGEMPLPVYLRNGHRKVLSIKAKPEGLTILLK